MEERTAILALSFIEDIGPITARSLLRQYGSACSVFEQRLADLEKVEGIGEVRAKRLLKDRKQAIQAATAQIQLLEKQQQKLVVLGEADFPQKLEQCADAPMHLFYRGHLPAQNKRLVAVVGTRMASDYGKQLCRELVECLGHYDVGIVSGLAKGIDIVAHKTALQCGIPTWAVVAGGFSTVYPAAHKESFIAMQEKGGVITEYPFHFIPDKRNFPARNRIVAGLCDATVMVESKESGGAMITAYLASDYNRDVFSFPANVNQATFKGNHKLIKEQRAHLIEAGEDLAQLMGWTVKNKVRTAQASLFPMLNEEERKVMDCLSQQGVMGLDALLIKCGWPFSKLAAVLLQLEFKGLLRQKPGQLVEAC